MTIPFVQVDAFTSEAFTGNPAAVVFLPPDAAWMQPWMQKVALEMNLAETAFLRPLEGQGGRREFLATRSATALPSGFAAPTVSARTEYELRWFTPTVEVDLCGHATLASAHALWESGRLAPGEIARFHTRSGVLTAAPDTGGADESGAGNGGVGGNGGKGGSWIQLDFPLTPNEPVPAPEGLVDALGAGTPLYVGRSKFDYVVQVESEAVIRGIAPDLRRLSAIEARGVIVTSKAANGDYDFVSRFFAPRAGIDEDPVTGSAHCTLADFWRRQLGKTRFLARQISPRGGVVRVTLKGDRVLLGGQAITVLRGELLA